MYYQAGDTLLFKTKSIPKNAAHLKGESILHHGNSGHHHRLIGSGFGIYKHGETKYVDVVEPTDYVHEEHATIKLDPGKYELRFVQEQDHFNDLVRAVVD